MKEMDNPLSTESLPVEQLPSNSVFANTPPFQMRHMSTFLNSRTLEAILPILFAGSALNRIYLEIMLLINIIDLTSTQLVRQF